MSKVVAPRRRAAGNGAARSTTEARRVLNAFRSLTRELRLADRSGVSRYGLGSAQIYVLHQLAAESPLSVNDLAERTATDQSTVSVVVSKLEEKGLVERRRSRLDGRRAELSLSRKGRSVASRLPLPFQASFLDALEKMEPARLREVADTLEHALKDMGAAEGTPPMLLEDESPSAK